MTKQSAFLLFSFLLIGQLAMLATAQEDKVVTCDVDAGDLTKKEVCADAPMVYNLKEESTVYNSKVQEKIDAHVISQVKIISWWWSLDNSKHSGAENSTFFEKIKRADEYDLIIDPAQNIAPKEYSLILYVLNERSQVSTKKFNVTLKEPNNWVTMEVNPKTVISLTDEVVFKIAKTGENEVFYVLSYIRGNRMISIEATNINKGPQNFEIKYHFPVTHQAERNLEIVFDYYTLDDQKHSLFENITLKRPDGFNIQTLERHIEKFEDRTGTIDVKFLLSVVSSLFTYDFEHEYHYTEHDFLKCDKNYCNNHGSCEVTQSLWKKCNCDFEWEGPTCAFKRGTEEDTYKILRRSLKLLDRASWNEENMGHITELIKAAANPIHIYNGEAFDLIIKFIDRAADSLGKSVTFKNIIEDLFMAVENLLVAYNKNYWMNIGSYDESTRTQIEMANYAQIKLIQAKLDPIYVGIMKYNEDPFFNHAMEKFGITVVKTTPNQFKGETEDIHLQSEMGKDLQINVDTIVKLPREYLKKNYKGGSEPLGVLLSQSFYNPFHIKTGNNYVLASQFVTLKLRDPKDAKVDLQFTDEDRGFGFVLKADHSIVKNIKDVECGRFDRVKFDNFNMDACKAILHTEFTVECYCEGPGEVALVVKKEKAKRRDDPTNFEVTKCDVDANDLVKNEKCKEAPQIVNLREDVKFSTKQDEKVDAFVVSSGTVRHFYWELDSSKHSSEQNKTFFEKVDDVDDYDLMIPAGTVAAGTYHLILHVLNDRRKESFKRFTVTLEDPSNWIDIQLSTKECYSLNDEVTITLKKAGKDEVFYALSYVRGEKLVSIETGIATDGIAPIKTHFPIFHQAEKEVTIVVDYYLLGGDRNTNQATIKVKRPNMSESDLQSKLREIQSKDSKSIDLKWTLAVVTSLITMDFKEDYHHTEHDFVKCDNNYCNDNGECFINPISDWKTCGCKEGFEGDTCAFSKGKESQAVELLRSVTELLTKVEVTPVNIGHMTEIIKIVAGTIHVFNWDIIDGLTENIDKAVKNLGNAVSYRDVFEDIFIAVENIDIALIKHYWQFEQEGKNPELANKVYDRIMELRSKFEPIFKGILKTLKVRQFFNHPMEKCGTTLVVFNPAQMTNEIDNVVLQSELGKRNQNKVDTVVGLPKQTLMNGEDGHKDVGIVLFQSFYSPYTSIAGDAYIPVSHSVTIKFKDMENNMEDLPISGEVLLLLKADRQKVVNMMDVHCGRFDSDAKVYLPNECETFVLEDNQVQCTCMGAGDYVLLLENPEPKREKEDRRSYIICDIDADDVTLKKECAEAPTIVNLRENAHYNTFLDEKIDAFVISQHKLKYFYWSLDPQWHSDEQNVTFFEIVKRVDDFDLMIPAKKLERGDYYLVLYAINDKKRMSIKQFNITLNDPKVWITMEVPKFVTAFNEDVTFKFTKTGIEDIIYLLSYFRNNQLVTIDTGSVKGTTIKDITYRFPVFHTDNKHVEIVFDYWAGEQKHTVFSNITVKKPAGISQADLEKALDEIEKKDDKTLDMKRTLVVITSLMSMDFQHDHHHTEHNFLTCDDRFCNKNGQCNIDQTSGWKQCNCTKGFEGATCAFATNKQQEAIKTLKRAMGLIDRCAITLDNVGDVTELVKVISSSSHIVSWELVEGLLKNINKIVKDMGKAVQAREVTEDIFISVENLKVALMTNFWANPTTEMEEKTYNKIQELNEALDATFRVMIDFVEAHSYFRHPMEKCGFAVTTTSIKKLEQEHFYEEIFLQADMGRQNQYRVDTVVYLKGEYLAKYKNGKEDIGVFLYQTYYNPFTIFTGDEYVPVSHSVTVKFKDIFNKTEVNLVGGKEDSINIHLKADKDQVSNLKDLECAKFNNKTRLFDIDQCVPTLHDDFAVDCACSGPGEYVLVIKNPQPNRKRENKGKKEEEKGKVVESRAMTIPGIIVGFVLICGVWGATYVAGLREGLPNPPYNENMTIHPVYSILKVYSGDTARSVRVHLFFITLASQLAAVVYLHTPGQAPDIMLAVYAILLSIPANYSFGLIARSVAGGFKQLSKGYFIIFADLVILAAVISVNFKLADVSAVNDAHVKELIKMFIIAVGIDLLILDTIMAQLGKIPVIKVIVALRGFYSPPSAALGDVTQYLRQPEVAL